MALVRISFETVRMWLIMIFSCSSSIVALTLKIVDPSKMEHYRPISLSNFKIQIITKIIVDKLSSSMPNITFHHQRGFV